MNKKQLFTAISLLAMSGLAADVGASTPAKKVSSNPFKRCEALKGSKLAKADCACDLALNDGTVKTIQLFINRYVKEVSSTACGAWALTLDSVPQQANATVPIIDLSHQA